MTHARLYIASQYHEIPELAAVRQQSADIEHFIEPAFGIATARALQARASLRPVEDTTRQFLIHFSSITVEAQNALLKLFEDPPETAIFHIVVGRADMLLPTVRSRLQLVHESAAEISASDVITEFMSLSLGERMAEITKRTKAKDVAWVEAIAVGAESIATSLPPASRHTLISSVVFTRQYLGNRGSSAKMLLESLALDLPSGK